MRKVRAGMDMSDQWILGLKDRGWHVLDDDGPIIDGGQYFHNKLLHAMVNHDRTRMVWVIPRWAWLLGHGRRVPWTAVELHRDDLPQILEYIANDHRDAMQAVWIASGDRGAIRFAIETYEARDR